LVLLRPPAIRSTPCATRRSTRGSALSAGGRGAQTHEKAGGGAGRAALPHSAGPPPAPPPPPAHTHTPPPPPPHPTRRRALRSTLSPSSPLASRKWIPPAPP
jgi:hypothetical protein